VKSANITGIPAYVKLVFWPFGCGILIWAASSIPAAEVTDDESRGNSICYVCHRDLASEEIATSHEKAKVTCMSCHGDSTVHIQDEMLMTKPDVLFGRTEVEQMCTQCHDTEKDHSDKAKVEQFRNKWRGFRRPNGRPITAESVCTDCHGTHNIVKDNPGKTAGSEVDNWEATFNGRDLSGWRQGGGAEWEVKGGRIVGRGGRKGGTILSEAIYKDFLLSVTFCAVWPLKAAILLRTEDGMDGARIEIFDNPKPQAYTGSVSLADKGLVLLNIHKDLFDQGGWNTISAEVKGERFAVWLNGEEVGAVCLSAPSKGRIGLSVERHPGNRNAELNVREILVQRLGEKASPAGPEQAAGRMTPLFNGRDLDGWEGVGGASWYVEDGALVGTQGPNNAPGDLLTKASYKDFELKVTYRVEWPCNSGIWFRHQSESRAYQADILEYKNPECYSGTLYCPGKMFLAMNTDKALVNRGGWNTMVVRAEGDHLQIWLNDRQVADVRDNTSDSGRIGFQVHAGSGFGAMRIVVREVLIRPLDGRQQ